MQLLSGDARRAVFAPLDDGALRSEAVVRRVGSAIALGLLADGEQLPAETDLATMLNASTVTLRAALDGLREVGLGRQLLAVPQQTQPDRAAHPADDGLAAQGTVVERGEDGAPGVTAEQLHARLLEPGRQECRTRRAET